MVWSTLSLCFPVVCVTLSLCFLVVCANLSLCSPVLCSTSSSCFPGLYANLSLCSTVNCATLSLCFSVVCATFPCVFLWSQVLPCLYVALCSELHFLGFALCSGMPLCWSIIIVLSKQFFALLIKFVPLFAGLLSGLFCFRCDLLSEIVCCTIVLVLSEARSRFSRWLFYHQFCHIVNWMLTLNDSLGSFVLWFQIREPYDRYTLYNCHVVTIVLGLTRAVCVTRVHDTFVSGTPVTVVYTVDLYTQKEQAWLSV